MTKMGSFTNFLANQLAETQQAAGPRLANRIGIGKKLLSGAGKAIQGVDSMAGGAVQALLRPGPENASRALGPLEMGYQGLKGSPGISKAVAFGLPAYYFLRDQTAKDVIPVFNEAIQEGREVYANEKEFLEKKAAQQEKTAIFGMPNMSGLTNLAKGVGRFGSGMGRAFQNGVNPGQIAESAGSGLKALSGGGTGLGAGMLGGAALLGGGALLGKLLGKAQETAQYQANRAINPLTDRVRADELMATSFFNNIGSEMAKSITSLLKDVASKAVTALKPDGGGPEFVAAISHGDPILSRASPEALLNAYHTMSKFAPTLSTDENAVRSFLREAVVVGSGPDYATISALAKAEANIRNAMNPGPKANL